VALSSGDPTVNQPSAVMTQTATFPNIELRPKIKTQSILYFFTPMGTLNEVDLILSASASGPVPPDTIVFVNIGYRKYPVAVREASVASAPQTIRLTEPAALVAFMGRFSLPITVTPPAPGAGVTTSVMISVIYRFTPHLA
jgi:hypothetical protein